MFQGRMPRVCAVVTARLPGDLASRFRVHAKTWFGSRRVTFEDKPHVTVKWGLLTEDPAIAAAAVAGVSAFSFTLGRVAVFRPGRMDVVVVGLRPCPQFEELHRRLSALDALPDSFAFRPHVTICRADRGTGERVEGRADFDGVPVLVDRLVFSTRQRVETVITLPVPASVVA
jgi:2'-5' RNA ligase